ncbi:hypothetical protein HRW18_16745 [Streptomyces lunaelactis]|uniref:hypothetical protein n=1 Tax=Streptomyces lunaelactis TaxID=1535768 RepID=UPI0015858227|nr:hypothetical protein [Streptomyces lunaelactis]NUK09624.1 hypothetical protein [Streptomyces lunaelactis]NUL13816.1 hypothetical protein [Streptomyces lunaelactis]NUL23662.1 hypothetical protein [Streptomyces lunaelactis]
MNARVKKVSLVPELDLTPFLSQGLTYDFANRWIMPKFNRLLAARLTRTAQGCDVPHADLVYVSTCPVPIHMGASGLPDRLAQALEEAALRHARELGPGVRQMVARAAINGATSPEVFVGAGPSSASKALVHTSYFDMPDVLRLICAHIAASSRAAILGPGLPERDLREWLGQTRERVARRIREL